MTASVEAMPTYGSSEMSHATGSRADTPTPTALHCMRENAQLRHALATSETHSKDLTRRLRQVVEESMRNLRAIADLQRQLHDATAQAVLSEGRIRPLSSPGTHPRALVRAPFA
jgi:hypothetical protein